MVREEVIIRQYASLKLSEMQVAERFAISANKVRRILDKHNVERRSRSEAIRYLYITKFNKRPFVLKRGLTREEEVLKAVGVMLYWGEGSKRGSSVAFSNSDPHMIAVFLNFLRTICGIDEGRLRVTVHYYRDLDIAKLISYWSRITKIPEDRFYKPYLHAKTKGTYRTKSVHGTISVQYSDSMLLKQINSWISEYYERFGSL